MRGGPRAANGFPPEGVTPTPLPGSHPQSFLSAMSDREAQDRPSLKFERRCRLTTRAEYNRVFTRHKVSQDRLFRVLARSNDRTYCRLGLAVSTRVCKRAVGRNRLKRVIRESFRAHGQELAAAGGKDIVVLPSPMAATICNSDLCESLQNHWRRIAGTESPPVGANRRKLE